MKTQRSDGAIRLAWFSPLSIRSGISHNNQNVLRAMRRSFSDDEVQVVVFHPANDGEMLDVPYPTVELSPEREPPDMRSSHDVPVYNVGNNVEHQDLIHRALMHEPGVVILQDHVLQDYLAGLHGEDGRVSQSFGSLAWSMGGPHGFELLASSGILPCDDGPVDVDAWSSWTAKFPFCDTMARLGYGAVVHTDYSARGLGRDYPGSTCRLFLPVPEQAPAEEASFRKSSADLDRGIHLVFNGRLGHTKSLGLLLAAFRDNPRLQASFRVTLAGFGDAPAVRHLQTSIGEAGLSDVFELQTGLSPDGLRDVMLTADVFYNLRYPNPEAASLALTEQMSLGAPSIVYATGSFAEIPADTCYVVEPVGSVSGLSDCLLSIARDPGGLIDRGSRAHDAVRGNRPDVFVERLVSYIRDNVEVFRRRRGLLSSLEAGECPEASETDRYWLQGVSHARRWMSGVQADDRPIPDGFWLAGPRAIGRYVALNILGSRVDEARTGAIGDIVCGIPRAEAIGLIERLARLSRRVRYGPALRAQDAPGQIEPVLDLTVWRLISLTEGERAISYAREALGVPAGRVSAELLETTRVTVGFRSMVSQICAEGRVRLGDSVSAAAFRNWLASVDDDPSILKALDDDVDILRVVPTGRPRALALFRGFGPLEDHGVWTTSKRATVLFRPAAPVARQVEGRLSWLPSPDRQPRMVKVAVCETASDATEALDLTLAAEGGSRAWSIGVDGYADALEVAFEVDRFVSPLEATGSLDRRELGIYVQSLSCSSMSASDQRIAKPKHTDSPAATGATAPREPLPLAGLKPRLPDEQVAWLSRRMAASSGYMEFGSGGSTDLAARNVPGLVLSVESSSDWVRRVSTLPEVKARLSEGSLVLHHANIGPTADWGRPRHQATRKMGMSYAFDALLTLDAVSRLAMDLALVDGRFRVACAVSAMLLLSPHALVMVDDYADRPDYRALEEVAGEPKIVGRAAVFSASGIQFDRGLAMLPQYLEDWR